MARSRLVRLSASLWLAFILSLSTSALAPRLHARTWSMRMSHPVLSEIVGRGMQRSPTFRRLVSRLQASDVVVQVRLGTELSPDTGLTEFVSADKGVRFVRITMNVAEASDAAVALLAHELRHAVEIADAQTVSDAAGYAGLYRAIGFVSCEGPVACYDTQAAVEAGRRVMKELKS